MAPTQISVHNRLLKGLDPIDFDRLTQHLSPRIYAPQSIVSQPGDQIEEIYFPERGMVSLCCGDDTEVGLIGREGVSGSHVVLGSVSTPFHVVTHLGSEGLQLPVHEFISAMEDSASLRTAMLRYVHTLLVQIAEGASFATRRSITQRTARFILMYCSRSGEPELRVTHEQIAAILHVRRPGITVATHILEGQGLIKASRARITIRDFDRLRDFSTGGYEIAEAEYDRVMAPQNHRERLGATQLSEVA